SKASADWIGDASTARTVKSTLVIGTPSARLTDDELTAGEHMKVLYRLLGLCYLSVLIFGAGCRKATKTKEVASNAPQDTMLPRDRSPANSSATRSRGDPCDSPDLTAQRYCLNRSIVANDADLNRTYQELVAQARKSGGPDLEDRFRQSQREWINQRDSDCTAQTQSQDGKLWARARARCLGDYSSRRTAELQRNLSGLRGQ